MVIAACMEQLTEQERQIVALHALAGFKHREIAAILRLPLPTVLSKYNRALKKLRQHLEGSRQP
jgi:RNA polymerase sigma-70 factor (ECF subfamily)